MRSVLPSCLLLCALAGACSKSAPEKPTTGTGTPATAAASTTTAVAAPPRRMEREADRVGGVIARAPGTDGVFIADEDHGLLRWIADTSPLLRRSAAPAAAPSPSAPAPSAAPSGSAAPAAPPALDDHAAEVTQETLAMGGAPANLVALRDGALVTVRDPGKLVRVRRGDDGKLTVLHEVALAADAWGLAVNEAGTRALVTSAWTSTVTLVEIGDGGLRKCAEVSVGREPRAVVFASDGVAYVNHLVGNALTRLRLGGGCDAGGIREAQPLVVAPSPVRSPAGKILPASLGYALALSPDDRRLFVPRHALGARAQGSWFGAATVDVLSLPEEASLAPLHAAGLPGLSSPTLKEQTSATFGDEPAEAWSAFVQPRDIRARRGAGTVLVASEGADRLVELDAGALDPAQAIAAVYELSDSFRRQQSEPLPDGVQPSGGRRAAYVSPSDANPGNNTSCAAPQGVVLDAREETAMVFCRASTTIARMVLHASIASQERLATAGLGWARLGEDADPKAGNLGRRLFYSSALAEGMGCAGCHPEGRDDGHVWREVSTKDAKGPTAHFLGGPDIEGTAPEALGVPRRTPMLVDRVLPAGPYGWRAESATLEKRVEAGVKLHAGAHPPDRVPAHYVNAVAVFVRRGLLKPPAAPQSLTPEEQKGRTLFADPRSSCTSCHEPTRYFSNQTAMRLGALPTLPGFEAEPDALYKTPSLLHVGHHGPLFHDGSAKTLEELVEKNGTRMGDTAHLTPEERKALVAYLRTL